MCMKTLKIRSMTLGEGREKLICPINAPKLADALECAATIAHSHADAAEYRADMSLDAHDPVVLMENLRRVRLALGDMPLMFTYRTDGAISPPALDVASRAALTESVINDGVSDMIDIEYSMPDAPRLISLARASGVASVLSRHDFGGMPEEDELFTFVAEARRLGANVTKYACMVHTKAELLRLLSFTERVTRDSDAGLVIAVPMGQVGTPGRLVGGLFGSCMSFCAFDAPNAPGQVELERAYRAINALHG